MAESTGLAPDPKKKPFSKLDGILELTEKMATRPAADYATLTEEEKRNNSVEWLTSMWQGQLNGILGDQMGAGGIISTLTFIARLKEEGHHGPYMIVTSLGDGSIINWMKAIK